MPNDKRRQYRTSGPDESLDVQVRLRGATVPGRLVDVSGWGTRVAFEAGEDPKLAPGQRLVVQFMQARDEVSMGTAAEVRNRVPRGHEVVYGLQFVDLARLHRFLPSALRPYFNRRRSYRVQTAREAPVEARVELGDRSLRAPVQDLSGEGFALLLPEGQEEALEGRRVLPVAIEIPRGAGTTVALVAARIVYRGTRGSARRAGFALEGAPGPRRVGGQRLLEYVMARQRSSLARKDE